MESSQEEGAQTSTAFESLIKTRRRKKVYGLNVENEENSEEIDNVLCEQKLVGIHMSETADSSESILFSSTGNADLGTQDYCASDSDEENESKSSATGEVLCEETPKDVNSCDSLIGDEEKFETAINKKHDSSSTEKQKCDILDEDETSLLDPRNEDNSRSPEEADDCGGEPEARTSTSAENIDQKKVFECVDRLFAGCDKDSVTVRDIVRYVENVLRLTIEKPLKKAIRQHLTDLMIGDSETKEESEEDGQGAGESEEEAASEDEYKEEKPAKKSAPRRPRRRTSARTRKVSAVKVHAEMMRKRRMEERQVRNEELQVMNDKKDQERAQQIARRFETNSEDQRMQRLEERLTLLQKLDNKRRQLLVQKVEQEGPPSVESTEDSDSEDDTELEIVKAPSSERAKPRVSFFFPPANSSSRSPQKTTSRAALRLALKKKQRKAGNLWLARELGYNNVEEHMRDCIQANEQKRKRVVQLEEQRLLANNKKHLSMDIANNEEEGDDEEEFLLAMQGDNESHLDADTLIVAEDKAACLHHDDEGNCDEDDDDKTVMFDVPNVECQTHLLPSEISINGNAEVGSAEDSRTMKEHQDGRTIYQDASTPAVEQNDEEAACVEHGRGAEATELNEDENEFQEDLTSSPGMTRPDGVKKSRNAGWQAILKREAEKLNKLKRQKGDLVDLEAEEEEEEEVAGLEDFGFSVHKKRNENDEGDDAGDDKLNEEDLKHVVDDVSDDEGDEEAGEAARKALEQKEEKERHKEILRRMRDGYDGRRGGIAGSGVGARGVHRFDQLVAADNREDAKRLGLLNDDELESDDENETKNEEDGNQGEIEDETALLDKMLKDRFLHRTSVDEEMQETFSDDEAEDETCKKDLDEDNEETTQEQLAKRFAKRARMQRLLETHGEDEEFSQQRLIDEDGSMKLDLLKMKNASIRNRRQASLSSTRSSFSSSSGSQAQHTNQAKKTGFSSLLSSDGRLALALQASRRTKTRTSFLGGKTKSRGESTASIHKNVSLNHVVFQSSQSQSQISNVSFAKSATTIGKRKRSVIQASTSLWTRVSVNDFKKRNRK